MKQLIAGALVLITTLASGAVGDHSPRLYYNRFHKELNNFQLRSMTYYVSHLQETDEATLLAHHQKVVRQLKQGQSRIKAAPVYKGDAELKEGYLAGLDSLLVIFENDFSQANRLRRYKNLSYQQLQAYYTALETAENKARQAEEYLYTLELQFAQAHHLRLQRETYTDQRYQQYKTLQQHYRILHQVFIKVHFEIEQCQGAVKNNPHQNLDTFALSQQATITIALVEEAYHTLKELEIAEGLDLGLYEATLDYLKTTKKRVKKEMLPALQVLEATPYYTIDFKNARTDLDFFSEGYHAQYADLRKRQKEWLRQSLEQLQLAP